MAENNDPPRRSQPFLDTLKAIKALNRSPIWRERQAAIAKLREQSKALLALPPDLAEAIRQARESEMEPTAEPVAEPRPAAAAEPAIEQPAAPVEEPAALAEEPTVAPSEVVPIKRIRPRRWAAVWRKANPQREGEDASARAQRMCNDMAKDPNVTEAWPVETCRRELYRKPKDTDFAPDPDSVQTFPKTH
jgi:hypothetical protein